MFQKILSFLKEPGRLFQVIGTLLTLCTVLFAIFKFYSRFTNLEDRIDIRISSQEKLFQSVLSQQTDRIQNIETTLMIQANNFQNSANAIIRSNRKKQPQTIIYSATYQMKDTTISKSHILDSTLVKSSR